MRCIVQCLLEDSSMQMQFVWSSCDARYYTRGAVWIALGLDLWGYRQDLLIVNTHRHHQGNRLDHLNPASPTFSPSPWHAWRSLAAKGALMGAKNHLVANF
jgi:hypothetical protein